MRDLSTPPKGWRVVQLGDVAEITFSGVDKKKVDGEIPIQLCNYTDVFYNRRIQPGMDFMEATATPRECKRWGLRRSDVLFTKDSETPDEIGVSAYVTEDMPNVLCGYHLGMARPRTDVLDGQFLAEALGSQGSRREFARIANGITRFGLTLNSTRSLPILLPPLSEQRTIAIVLVAIDEAIERTKGVISAIERLRDAQLHELLTYGVCGRHTTRRNVTGLGNVPEDWKVVRLGEIYQVQLGKMLSPKAKLGRNPKPYLTNRHVQWDNFDLLSLPVMDFDDREIEKFQLQPGDLLVCEGGETGRAAVWEGQINDCYYQKALHRLRPIDADAVPRFMLAVLMLLSKRGILLDYSPRTSISHLTRQRLLEMRVPHPPRSDQLTIAAVIRATGVLIERTTIEKHRLETLKQSLANCLLAGKTRTTPRS